MGQTGMRCWICIAAMMGMTLLTIHCGDDDDWQRATGGVTAFSECKAFNGDRSVNGRDISGLPEDKAGVEYEYDIALLRLTHVNAGFNCCPGELSADIIVRDATIEIHEQQEKNGCRCDCLYDIEFEIWGLVPGEYTIKIVEPLLPPGNEEITFAVDLSEPKHGKLHRRPTRLPVGKVRLGREASILLPSGIEGS